MVTQISCDVIFNYKWRVLDGVTLELKPTQRVVLDLCSFMSME